MPRMTLVLIVCCTLLAGACSDDTSPPPTGDSAADLNAADHTVQPDVATKDSTPKADTAADTAAQPDADTSCANVTCNLKQLGRT